MRSFKDGGGIDEASDGMELCAEGVTTGGAGTIAALASAGGTEEAREDCISSISEASCSIGGADGALDSGLAPCFRG